MTNYYDVLGVNIFADQREIKATYKKLAIQFHPDKHGGNKVFEEKFKVINEAFQVLSNPTLRNRYDHKMFYSQPVEGNQYSTTQTVRPTQHTRRPRPKVVRVTYSRKQYIMASMLFLGLLLGAIALFIGMSRYAGNKYFQEGEAYFQQKSYELAMTKYMEVLEVDPDHPQANERMGDLVTERIGNTELGLVFYEKALTASEKPSSLLFLKTCKVYLFENQSPKARQHLENMLVIYPENTDAWCMLGKIFLSENDFQKAWDAYQKANSVSTSYESLYGSALAGYQLGNYTKTIEYCNQILQEGKMDAAGIMLRGKSYLSLGDSLKACQDFTKADLYNFPTAQVYKTSICKNF